MRVSFTGTKAGMTKFQQEGFLLMLNELSVTELVHGDCVGSDAEANFLAIQNGVKIFHLFPSDLGGKRAFCFGGSSRHEAVTYNWNDCIVTIERPEKPLDRNKKIVDQSDVLIATPKEHSHTLRSGTWATIRYAWKRKKKVVVIPPIVRDEPVEEVPDEENS